MFKRFLFLRLRVVQGCEIPYSIRQGTHGGRNLSIARMPSVPPGKATRLRSAGDQWSRALGLGEFRSARGEARHDYVIIQITIHTLLCKSTTITSLISQFAMEREVPLQLTDDDMDTSLDTLSTEPTNNQSSMDLSNSFWNSHDWLPEVHSQELNDLSIISNSSEQDADRMTAGRSRNWCFTINNPQCLGLQRVRATMSTTTESSGATSSVPVAEPTNGVGFLLSEAPYLNCSKAMFPIKLCVWQLERGSSGTLHIQGYLEMKSSQRPSTMFQMFSGKAHLEKRMGTRCQAVKYVVKDDNGLTSEDVETFGKGPWTHPTDLDLASITEESRANASKNDHRFKLMIKDVKNEMKDEDLIEKYGQLFSRHLRCIDRMRLVFTNPRKHVMNVIVLQGPTGCGKSKWPWDNFNNIYPKSNDQWWDSYENHETVLLDDFYGNIKWSDFLKLLDRYPFLIPFKGGYKHFTSKNIIITTNTLPCKWYKFKFEPVARRISKYMVWNDDSNSFDVFDNTNSVTSADSMRVYLQAYNSMKDYYHTENNQ